MQLGLTGAHRILLVDDDDAVRNMMSLALLRKRFRVTAASSVPEALGYIASERFDVLLTDLHMPSAGDGFTVVSAMRHSQPDALTLLLNTHPDVKNEMSAILLDTDEILAKPFEIGKLSELIKDRLTHRTLTKKTKKIVKERVSAVLERCANNIVTNWLNTAKQSRELNRVKLSDEERTGHLPMLIQGLVLRLKKTSTEMQDTDAIFSAPAGAHGRLRYRQGYRPEMLVQESRILQVTVFGTLKSNFDVLDFSLLLPDVMALADEVDTQLGHSLRSYMERANLAA